MTEHEQMMQGLRELIRAVFLKAAYQLAGRTNRSSCEVCGLPATRTFVSEKGTWFDDEHLTACPDCRPTDPSLVKMLEHPEARGVERLLRAAKGEDR